MYCSSLGFLCMHLDNMCANSFMKSEIYQVQNLWKTAYKLTKQFAHPDFRGPKTAAIKIKTRLETFKIHMPLINALCNPGIKQRHWDMMNEKVSFLWT